jgi:phosphoserine phosphatase RsbU/P
MSDTYLILVDDEENILSALRRELHDWAYTRGLTILTFNAAKEALRELESKGAATKLIMSDLKMPEMKGSDFLLTVKDLYPHVVSILLTGYSEAEEVVKAVRAGIFSYLLKPWDRDYLLAEVEKAYDFYELRVANEQRAKTIEEELKWAGEMQRVILRPQLPHSEGVEFRVSYRPLPDLHCGGDYYDVVYLGPGRFFVLMGDVTGHGVRAAFITGILKAVIYPEYIRANIGRPISPADFLTWLNERMNFELRSTSGLVISFFAGIIDLREGVFRFANAGQTHPFVVRNGKAQELLVSGTAIGEVQTVHYSEQAIAITGNDILFFYTDGLVSFGGQDEASRVKLGPILEAIGYPLDFHKKAMEEALKAGKARGFSDDLTIVTARVNA